MKVILHIGTHKTGTTTLQHFLTANKEGLAERGFCYSPELMPQNKTQHSEIALLFKRGMVKDAADLLKELLEPRGEIHTAILSGEEFNDMKLEQLSMLKGLLASHDVTVVLYVRNLYDYYYSVLSEHSKGKVYLTSPEALMMRMELRPDDIILKWESLFGHDNVMIRSYDLVRQGHGLLRDFIENVLRIRDFPVLNKRRDDNRSIDHITATFFNRLNSASSLDFRQLWGTYYQLTSKRFRFESVDKKIYTIFEKTVKRAPVSHPKLESFRDLLITMPSGVETTDPILDVLEYLRFMGQLINATADILEKNLYLKPGMLKQKNQTVHTYEHLLNIAVAKGENAMAEDIRRCMARFYELGKGGEHEKNKGVV